MNSLQPVRFYIAVLMLFLAALVAATLYFLAGMASASYLVTDGVSVTSYYLDKPRYDMHLQGLIFAVSFLLAGVLLVLLILIPDQPAVRSSGPSDAPQPRRRPQDGAPQPAAGQGAAQTAAQTTEQPAPEAPAAAATAAAPAPAAAPATHQGSPLSIEGGDAESAPEPTAAGAQAPATRSRVSVEEEVLKSAVNTDDLPSVDFGDNRFDDTGDEDVVYGNGRITEDAAWDFVQQYPDSSVKFLYRKTLDNKTLSPTEEDIYRNWEMRGLSRAKVREIVLEIMRWQSLPDNFPHEIWRALRDQIYEIKSR